MSRTTTLLSGSTVIQNLPAGGQWSIKRLGTQSATGWSIAVQNCAGTVLLEDVQTAGTRQFLYAMVSLDIASSAHVLVNRSDFFGRPGIRVTSSNCLLSETLAAGESAFPPPSTFYSMGASAGVVANASMLTVSRCGFRGGDGSTTHLVLSALGQPGLIAVQSNVMVTGTGNVIRGGSAPPHPTTTYPTPIQAESIRANGGTLHYDASRITLIGPLTATGILVNSNIPTLAAAGRPPGQPITLELHDQPGTLGVIVLSLASAPAITSMGHLWVDPIAFGVLVVAPISGTLSHQFMVPPLATRGVSVVFQGLTFSPTGVTLSNGVGVLLE